MLGCLPAKAATNGPYYFEVMKKLHHCIKEKMHEKLMLGIVVFLDSALVHKSKVAQAAIPECGREELNHPAYNSDLSTSDYFLRRNLQPHLCGKRFTDDNKLESAVAEHLAE